MTAALTILAQVIRIARSLGMSLKEIAALSEERRKGRVTRNRSIEVLRGQLARLETKAAELETLAGYLRAKIKWLAAGGQLGNCSNNSLRYAKGSTPLARAVITARERG